MRPLRLSDVVLDRLISPVNERFWEWSEIGRYTFGSLRPNQSNQTTSLPRFHSHVSLLQTLYKGREVDQFGVVRHAYNSIEYQGIADKLKFTICSCTVIGDLSFAHQGTIWSPFANASYCFPCSFLLSLIAARIKTESLEVATPPAYDCHVPHRITTSL